MLNYFKTAFRNIWKAKSQNFLNIIGLATGIACAALIFLWVEDELGYDSNNLKKNQLYAIRVNKKFGDRIYSIGSTPRLLAESIKTDIPGIINTSRVSDVPQRALFSIGEKTLYAEGRFTDSSLFSMLTLPFANGNAENAFKQLYSMVITEKLAKKLFAMEAGNYEAIVGKSIRIDNKQDYIISAVLKDLPSNTSLQFEWLAPYEINVQQHLSSMTWSSYGPFTYVELDANTDKEKVNQQLSDYIFRKDASQHSNAFLFSMNDWRLYNQFENGKQTGGGGIEQVRMLSLIAWIILLIACINFMNLATSRSEKRAREVGVRKVLGADRFRLIARFMMESLMLSTVASLLALIVILVALPYYNALMQKSLSLQLTNPLHLISLLLIIMSCGIFAGSYPAFYLSSFKPVTVLKGLKIKSGSAALIRKGLVVLQFTVSIVFIISTIVIYRQVEHVKQRSLGFNKEQLIEIDLQQDSKTQFSVIKQALLNSGVTEKVALADHPLMMGGNNDDSFDWPGKPTDAKIRISKRYISPEYFSTLGMQIVQGKNFEENTATDSSAIIITQSLAKLVTKDNAVGTTIRLPDYENPGQFEHFRVIGVVNDYVYGDLYGKPEPVIFFDMALHRASMMYIRPAAGKDLLKSLALMENIIKQYNPGFPVEYKFVDDNFNKFFFNEIQLSRIAGIFAGLAIIISCLGLFGLVSYTAERRTKEIGIRKVLGASVVGIGALLSKEFLQLVLISFILAFPVAWWMMADWLTNYEYRTHLSIWIFVIAGLVVMALTLLTVSFQAIKAAVADPVNALRSE